MSIRWGGQYIIEGKHVWQGFVSQPTPVSAVKTALPDLSRSDIHKELAETPHNLIFISKSNLYWTLLLVLTFCAMWVGLFFVCWDMFSTSITLFVGTDRNSEGRKRVKVIDPLKELSCIFSYRLEFFTTTTKNICSTRPFVFLSVYLCGGNFEVDKSYWEDVSVVFVTISLLH